MTNPKELGMKAGRAFARKARRSVGRIELAQRAGAAHMAAVEAGTVRVADVAPYCLAFIAASVEALGARVTL